MYLGSESVQYSDCAYDDDDNKQGKEDVGGTCTWQTFREKVHNIFISHGGGHDVI